MKRSPSQGACLISRSWVALVALLLVSAVARAQTASLMVGQAAGLPGTSVDLPVSFAPGGTPVGALQFELTFPSSLRYVSTATGAAASATGKSGSGNAVSGGMRILVFGVNRAVVGSGIVVSIRLGIAGGTPAGSIAIGIKNITGTTPDANAVTVQGTGGGVTVNASADAVPPKISSVSATSDTATSAAVTWTTDEAADSQVEYGPTIAYGQKSSLNSTRTTAHSQTISGLTPDTLYHYRVKSRDAAGNLASSGDFTFTTLLTDLRIQESFYLPTFSLSGTAKDAYTGVAVVNLDTADAQVICTAFGREGNRVAGSGITNPAQRPVKRGRQLPILDAQLFGASAGSIGWVKVESTVRKAFSIFMSFDSSLTALDGANALTEPMRSAVVPEIGENGFSRIYLANPGSVTASVTLSLMRSDGTVRDDVRKQINANGELTADLYTELFPQAAADPSDYLWITSSGDIIPYELIAEAGKDTRILSGQDTTTGAAQLYSPQYVVGGPWRSTVSLVNLDPRPATVVMRFVSDGPSKAGKTISFGIPAYGKLYLSDQKIFLDPAFDLTRTIVQGYVEITSDGALLAGSVAFGNSGQHNFASTLPLVQQLSRNVVFSHTASNDTYFTGVALLNPGSTSAQVTIDLHSADGTLEATLTTIVPARSRKSQLLTEVFPSLIGKNRTSGYIRVTSSSPLASFALFGTNSLSVLSAIPAQPVP